MRHKGTVGRTGGIRGTCTPGEYDWGQEEKNNCRVPEELVWLIQQDIYALHKCHVSVLGWAWASTDSGPRCGLKSHGDRSQEPEDGRDRGKHGWWEADRVLRKCSLLLLLKPH